MQIIESQGKGNTDDLKPCPFCGRVWCKVCNAKASDKLIKKDAIAAWNRRTLG